MLEYIPQTNEVEVIRLEERDFQWQLLSNGKLTATRRSRLPFRTSGVITDIDVRNGQRVVTGELLGRLDTREQALALESARISFAQAELDLYDNLAGLGYPVRDTSGVPAEVLSVSKIRSGYSSARNTLSKAEYDYDGAFVRAPFSGVIADVSYDEYDMTGSDPLCTLIDDSRFDVDFMILETEYPHVREGMPVRVAPFGGMGAEAEGRVVSVNPMVDVNGQVLVRARISNSGAFVEGMNVRVTVERAIPSLLVVPKSAVVIRDRQHVLFRYRGGKAQWTYVNVLLSNSGSYAVEADTERGAALAAGDTVIVSGNLNIADGSEVILKSE